jgi:hypothetical protein
MLIIREKEYSEANPDSPSGANKKLIYDLAKKNTIGGFDIYIVGIILFFLSVIIFGLYI